MNSREAEIGVHRPPAGFSQPFRPVGPSGLAAGRLIDGDHDGQPGGNAAAIFTRRKEIGVSGCPWMAVALPVPLFFPRQFEVRGVVTRD